MSLFDTLFPPRMRSPTIRRPSARTRATIRRHRDGAFGEQLEQRLALAVVTPFAPRFTETVQGDITFAANTIMTAVAGLPGTPAQVADAQNGTDETGTAPGVWNDDFWSMRFIDIDADVSTFSSSSAVLDIPAGSKVLFAGLYWGGRVLGTSQFNAADTVKFRGPGDSGYQDLTATVFSSTDQGAPTTGARNYQGFKDVTSLVDARGEGTYTVANVQANQGNNYSAGWALVVAYRDDTDLPRNLTVFDGFAYVTTSAPDVTIPFSGFRAPLSGPVNATLGLVVYEGDLGITGDSAFFDGGLGEAELENATNPANNFFNSSISNRGVTVTSKTPNYKNQLGFGADLVEADNLIANNATSATLRLTTRQDFYYPGVITSAIEVYAPKTTVSKTGQDLNGGLVEPGDVLRYTVTVSNEASAYDTAKNVVLNDAIPAFTTYKPGSLVITSGANAGAMTDAIDTDQAEFIAGGNGAVRFRLGTGATGATVLDPKGGTLAAGQSTTVTFEVIVGEYPSSALIENVASVSYSGTFFGPFTKTAAFDFQCPSSSLTVTKTNNQTNYLPGETVTYTIDVTNAGPGRVRDAKVTDVFSTNANIASWSWTASASPGSSVTPLGPSNADINATANLAKGGVATFIVTAIVKGTATGNLVNTVNVAPQKDPFITVSSTDTDLLRSVLTVSKTNGQTNYLPGETVTYTIEVTNAGPGPVNGAKVTDVFSTNANIASWTWSATASAGSSVAPTGPLSTDIDATVNLLIGGKATFTVVALTKPTASGDLVNTVTVTPPKDTGNTISSTDTDAQSNPQVTLGVTKDDGRTTYLPNETFTYTIIVTNSGPSAMINGTINDPLPSQVASASWTATYSLGSSGPDFGIGGINNEKISLLPQGTATFLLTVTIKPNAFGQMDNTVTVTPPVGTIGEPATATDTNFGPEPPASIGGALVVGSDDGCNGPPWVRVLDPNSGEELSRFLAYDSRFRGSVRVATGDVTGDGVAEIITAPGRNAIGEVRVFQQALGGWAELTQYRTIAFGAGYRGGVEVAVADIDDDDDNDIVTAMSIRTGMVNVFRVTPGISDPVANAPFKSFRGAPAGTNNGVMISAGDYILGGPAEIAVGTNSGTRALVRVFDVSGTPTVVRSFKPFANNFRGGVTLSTSDYDGNGSLDLIVGAGLNGGSRVEVWNPSTTTRIAQVSAFSSLAKPNARVFAVFGSAADGFIGPDSTLYGVQGLNGGRGSKGVWKLLGGAANSLVNSQGSLPPLRIAPIALQLG